MHARGFLNPPHQEYKDLAIHLVSHGYVVAVPNRGLGKSWEDAPDMLEETVDFLYTKHAIGKNLLDAIVTIGHSSGARYVLSHARSLRWPNKKTPRNLIGAVLMAPQLSDVTVISKLAVDRLGESIKAFMGLAIADESDNSAAGAKVPKQPMRSVFSIYDQIGVISDGDGDVITVEKHMRFVYGPNNHFFHWQQWVRSFITAFLHRYVFNIATYDAYLRHLGVPPSTAAAHPDYIFSPQHERIWSLCVTRFDPANPRFATYFALGSVKCSEVWPYEQDETSPHVTRALRVNWSRPVATVSDSLNLVLKQSISVGWLKYLSFRIGQGFPDDGVGMPFEVGVRLAGKGNWCLLSNHGGKVLPPKDIVAQWNPLTKQTKSPMRTYRIPLEAFGIDLSSVGMITFEFAFNVPGVKSKATFYLDSVCFF